MRLRALLLRAAPSGAPRRPPASPATPGDPRRPPASSGVLLRQHVHRRPVRRAPALLHASAFEQHPHTVVHALHRQPGSPGDVLQPVPRLQPHKRGREIRRHGVHIRGDDKIPRLPPRRQFLRSHHRRLPAPAGRPHPTRDPVQRLGHAPQGRRHRVLTPGDHHLTASDHLLAPKDHFLAACHRVLAPKNHFLAACHRVLAPGHGAPVTLRLPQQLIPLSRPLLPLSRQPITLGHQGIALGQQFVPRRRPRRELLVRSNVPLLEPRRDSVGNLPRHAREGLGGCWCNQGPWPRPPPGTSASPQPASASAPAPCRREHEVVDVDRVLPVHRASPPCRKIGEESFNSRRNQ
jgi:hypothetical protein